MLSFYSHSVSFVCSLAPNSYKWSTLVSFYHFVSISPSLYDKCKANISAVTVVDDDAGDGVDTYFVSPFDRQAEVATPKNISYIPTKNVLFICTFVFVATSVAK